MKNIAIMVLRVLGRVGAVLFPPVLWHVLSSIRNYTYTGALQHRFASFGSSVFAWKAIHISGEQFIHIGDDNVFEPGLQLTAWKEGDKEPEIRIGNRCLFRNFCHITAVNQVIIGDDLLTGTNVLITDNSHGGTDHATLSIAPRARTLVPKGKVVIGNRVWLGNNVCVLPGVTIGDGAVVGANSVVTHDVPVNTVVAGIPAVVVEPHYLLYK